METKVLMKKLAHLLVIVALAPACGGTTPQTPTTPEKVETPTTNTQDIVLDKYPEVTLEGMRFKPQALGLPGMWKITPPKRATIKKYRRLVAKPDAPPATVQVFAGLLWNESNDVYQQSLQAEAAAAVEKDQQKQGKMMLKSEQLKAKIAPLRQEAVDALNALAARVGDDVEEITLQMLSVGEMTLGNDDAATAAYEKLVEKYPESNNIDNYKTWLTYLYLKAERNEDAYKLVADWNRDNLAPSIGFMANYVCAWTHFREGKLADARDEIGAAALGWKGDGRDAVSYEVLLMNGRAGAPVAEVDALLASMYGDSVGARYRALYTLKQAYFLAGFYKQAIDVLDLLASGKVLAEVPPNDQVAFPYEKSALELRLNDPAATADSIIKAYELLGPCGDKCTADYADAVTNAIHQYATLFHTIYATSMDEKYYEPAKKLYDYYLNKVPKRDNTDVILGYASRLKDTKENANPSQGKHDSEAIGKLLGLRYDVVVGCYEQVLQGEPGLTGKIKLTIDVKETGEVTKVEADPPAGDSGMGAVDKCLIERIGTWTLPGRTVPGTTAIVWPFLLKPKAAL